MVAPDYEPVEEWEKVPVFEASEDDEDEEGEEGEEGGDEDEEWYLSSNNRIQTEISIA